MTKKTVATAKFPRQPAAPICLHIACSFFPLQWQSRAVPEAVGLKCLNYLLSGPLHRVC